PRDLGEGPRLGARGQAKPDRIRAERQGAGGGPGGARISDHAQRARSRLSDGAAAPLAAVGPPNGNSPRAPYGGKGDSRFLRHQRLYAGRRTDFHARSIGGKETFFRAPFFRSGRLFFDPVRPVVQGRRGGGAGRGLLLRPDVPGGEEKAPPALDRVLDGRAGGRLHGPRGGHGSRRGL